MNNTAYLSSKGDIISFRYGSTDVRFKGPYSLEQIDKVTEWDHGYLVVLSKYRHADEPIEDYIDLVPILKNLYRDPDTFLKPIEKVEVRYE